MSKLSLQLGSAVARTLSFLVVVSMTMVAGPSFASIWTEVGDAGETQASAQLTSFGPSGNVLTDIVGTMGNSIDADLFRIYIFDPNAFSATTVGGSNLDTQLFLFTTSGAPVYTNDDDPGGSSLQSTLPAGNALRPSAPGQYLLGIALSGNDPINSVAQLLFALGLTTDVRGPAPDLQPAELGGFTGLTWFDESGGYDIKLTGALAVPEPATGLLLVLACVLCLFTVYNGRRRTLMPAVAA